MKNVGRQLLLCVYMLALAPFLNNCGGSSDSSTQPTTNDPALIGSWLLSTSNCGEPEGVTVKITATTIAVTVPGVGSMSGTYTAENGEVTFTITTVTGMGEEPGDKIELRYSVTPTTLILDNLTDPCHQEYSKQS